MNVRASLCLLLLVPACFNPEDNGIDADTDPVDASSGNGTTTDTPTSGTPTTTDPSTSTSATTTTTTEGTTEDPSTTEDPTDDSTTSTGGADTSTGEPGGRCSNGVAEPGDFCFDGFETVLVGCPATDLAVADLDGNDHLDIAYAAAPDAEVAVYLGSGLGSFVLGSQDAINTGVSRIALGNFDGNSGPDFAILNDDGDLGTLLNDGNGTIAGNGFNFVQGASGNALAIGSLDGDERADIVVVGQGQNAVFTALAADGVEPFTASNVTGTGNSFRTAVVVTELNGNANGDIVFASASGVFTCLGDGTGDVVNCNPTAFGSDPSDIVAGDFDGDGNIDIAVLDQMVSELAILLGQGNGGFLDPVIIQGTNSARRIEVADLNNDGFDDLAYAIPNPAELRVLLWDPDAGAFGDAISFPAGMGAFSDIAAGDFNEDGLPDLAIGNASASTISLLLSDA